MNYLPKDLEEVKKFPGTTKWMLTWDDNGRPPEKRLVVGMQIGDHPWITEAWLQDGTSNFYWQHAAEIPEDWTPYKEPKEIAFFEVEVGKKYRVVGDCGRKFDEIMYCVNKNAEGYPIFSDNKCNKKCDDNCSKKCVGTSWIQHVYTC